MAKAKEADDILADITASVPTHRPCFVDKVAPEVRADIERVAGAFTSGAIQVPLVHAWRRLKKKHGANFGVSESAFRHYVQDWPERHRAEA